MLVIKFLRRSVLQAYVERALEKKSLFMTFVLAFLVPGGGHFYLGKKTRSAIIFLLLTALSLAGLQFFGAFFIPQGEMSEQSFSKIFILLSVIVQLFNGIFYLVLAIFKSGGNIPHMNSAAGIPGMNEIGGTFLIISGLLNILIIMDAYDIAVGKKG
jgi:hypothetical protein